MSGELEALMGSGGAHRRRNDDSHLRWAWVCVVGALVLLMATSVFFCKNFFA